MSRFGGVFAGEEFALVVAFGGFTVVVVAFEGVIARCFVAGTVGVLTFFEDVVGFAVRGIVFGGILAGHAFGGLICVASFGNLVVVAITV
jgi:hypothetical protein